MKKVDSKKVAVALIDKLVKYEKEIDAKKAKSAAEKRHVEFLRGLRRF